MVDLEKPYKVPTRGPHSNTHATLGTYCTLYPSCHLLKYLKVIVLSQPTTLQPILDRLRFLPIYHPGSLLRCYISVNCSSSLGGFLYTLAWNCRHATIRGAECHQNLATECPFTGTSLRPDRRGCCDKPDIPTANLPWITKRAERQEDRRPEMDACHREMETCTGP